MNLILTSSSPRRKEILKMAGFDFKVQPANIDESAITCTDPQELVKSLSYEKANEIFKKGINHNDLLLGADTVVSYNNEILQKPSDYDDAYNMIALLQDRTHQVYTGVTMIWLENNQKKALTFCESTKVTFYPIDSFDIKAYLDSGDPFDKAGSYGIQGSFAKHVKAIEGEYNNVVGLPIGRIYQELLLHHLL